jgi:hypothetical protein
VLPFSAMVPLVLSTFSVDLLTGQSVSKGELREFHRPQSRPVCLSCLKHLPPYMNFKIIPILPGSCLLRLMHMSLVEHRKPNSTRAHAKHVPLDQTKARYSICSHIKYRSFKIKHMVSCMISHKFGMVSYMVNH